MAKKLKYADVKKILDSNGHELLFSKEAMKFFGTSKASIEGYQSEDGTLYFIYQNKLELSNGILSTWWDFSTMKGPSKLDTVQVQSKWQAMELLNKAKGEL